MTKKRIIVTESQLRRLVEMCAEKSIKDRKKNDINRLIDETVNILIKEEEKEEDEDSSVKYKSEVGKSEIVGKNGFVTHQNSDSNYNASERDNFIKCLDNPGLNLKGFWEEYIGKDKMSEELLQKISAGDRTAFDDSCDIISDALARFVSDMTI